MSEKLLNEMREAVISGDSEKARALATGALESGLDPLFVLENGFTSALRAVGEMWTREEIFLTQMMMAAMVVKEAAGVLEPEIRKRGGSRSLLGKVLIGTVVGDIHDIGKSIVATMLGAAGFEVTDVGVDVPADTFVAKVQELRPDVLGLSALLTTTMGEQEVVIKALKRANLRGSVKVIVGGAPVTAEWAERIGADAYAEDAVQAVAKVKELLNIST